jgi:integrase
VKVNIKNYFFFDKFNVKIFIIYFTVEFNGQWYHKQHVSEKEIKSFMKKIVTLTGINVDDRKISNHSGRKTLVQILKRRGFSNSECMASTRHKSEQGLARYEYPETEIQRNNAFNLVEAFGFNKNNIQSGKNSKFLIINK